MLNFCPDLDLVTPGDPQRYSSIIAKRSIRLYFYVSLLLNFCPDLDKLTIPKYQSVYHLKKLMFEKPLFDLQ